MLGPLVGWRLYECGLFAAKPLMRPLRNTPTTIIDVQYQPKHAHTPEHLMSRRAVSAAWAKLLWVNSGAIGQFWLAASLAHNRAFVVVVETTQALALLVGTRCWPRD